MGLVFSALSACCGAVSLASCCMRTCSCDLGGDDEEGGRSEGEAAGSTFLCTKVVYALYLLVGYVLALFVKDGMHGLTSALPFLSSHACEAAALHDLCYGHSYVFRISFSLVIFYLLHLLLSMDCGAMCGGAGIQQRIQTRLFGIKTLLLVGIFIVSVFTSTSFFSAYAKIALGGSGLFLVMQILILLDFAYEWNDAWIQKEEPKYNFLLVLCSFVFFAAGCTLIGLMYHWFSPSDDCTLNAAFIHITLIAGLLYILVAIRLEHVSILPATFVFMYSTFLCYGAIQTGSNSKECNLLWSENAEKGLSGQVLLSSAFAILTLLYSCLASSGSAGAFQLVASDEDAEPQAPASQFTLFHFIMVLGSMYMAMILTNWDTNVEAAAASPAAAMWVRIIAQWATIATFVWTMFAPLVLTSREF